MKPRREGSCLANVEYQGNFTDVNPSTQDNMLSLKNVIFTLNDGKLLVSPKELHGSNIPESFKTQSFNGSEAILSQSDEIHIEIIRENTVQLSQTGQTDSGENTINNLSSAYEAFWKYDFEVCMERRTCVKCAQVLLTPHCLLHHWHRVHETPHPSECFMCHKLFSDEEETKKHILETHQISQPECICEVCLEVFSEESDKNIHRELHAKANVCKWCQNCFPCQFLLNVHHYNCLYRQPDLDCHICGCHFKSSHMLQLHCLRHSRLTCDICQSRLPSTETEVDLIRHLKTCHSQDEINKVLATLKKQDREEETLDKLFISNEPIAKILDSKLSRPSPQVTLQSSLCDTGNFSVALGQQLAPSKCLTREPAENLINENITLSEPALQCAECLKTFNNKEQLLTHDLEHQMPFCCYVCEEKFPHRRKYKKHMRSHGILAKPGVIRYKCKQCSVCCDTISGLRTHLLTHTNQKPYLCDKCGLKFRRAQALRVHVNTVHSTRALHTCSLCGSGSLSKPSLLRHIQCVHGGVRRFICGLCGTRFLQNQDLRKHLKRIHDSDIPPMDRVSKISNKEIHVIPSIKNINPTDPLAILLRSAIKEEKSKLQALCQQSGQIHVDQGKDQSASPENCADGILLNILGDVASKAAPLEHKNAADILKPMIHQKLETHTKFLCAGCQYVSDSLNDFSAHLANCYQGKCVGTTEKKILNPVASLKEAQSLSTCPSFFSSSPSLANPFCIISSQDTGSTFHIGPSATSSCDNSFLYSVMNLGATIPQSQSATLPLAIGSLYCSNTVINESCVITSEQTILDNEPVKSFVNINYEESFNSSQLVGPNAAQSHNVSSQVISLPQRDMETCKLRDTSNLDMPLTNPSLDNTSGDLNQSSCGSQKRSAVFHNLLENTPVGFVMDEQLSQSEENDAKIMILPIDQDILLSSSSEQSKDISAVEPPLIDLAECSSAPQMSSKPINNKKGLPVEETGKANFWVRNVGKKTGSANEVANASLTNSIQSKHDNSYVSKKEVASLRALEFNQNVCPECGKRLSCASNFKRHLQVHFGQKAHECLYCGKSFRYKCNLTVHTRSHTGEKPYECPECKKNFRYQTELKEHKQSHEKSRSLSCKECGQSFIRQRDLKRHCLSHGSNKRPTCHICQKPFSRLDYLKIHIKSHRKQEEISSEGLEELKRDEVTVGQKYSEKKIRHQKELLFVCTFCSLSFESIKERKAHEEICKGNMIEVSDNLSNQGLKVQPAENTSVVSNAIDTNTSEDLISLAFQAAEDGVEFMFVEENSFVVNDTVEDQNIESNVIFVEVLDHNEY